MKRSSMKKGHKRRMSWGGNAGVEPYTSAASYEGSILGSENDQYARVFNQGGPNNSQSNAIMGNASTGNLGYLPYQRAGKRKTKKGGFLGLSGVVNQAVVPFSLVGLNQVYGKRRGSRKTRKHMRGGKRKTKKGGFLGLSGLVNQAVVPFSLVGLNQAYGKRRGTRKTRK